MVLVIFATSMLVGIYLSGYIAGGLYEARSHVRQLHDMAARADELHALLVKAFAPSDDPVTPPSV